MNRRIAGLLVGMLCGAMLSPAAAQSLGEVARKEAARREKIKSSGTVLTNADLPASAVVAPSAPVAGGEGAAAPTAGSTGPGAAPAAPADSAAAEKATARPAAAPRDDEEGWRARASGINKALADARAQVRQIKALSDRLALEMLATNAAAAARAAREREDVKAQLAKAETAEGEAFAARQALEQDARNAGVPPAWIQ